MRRRWAILLITTAVALSACGAQSTSDVPSDNAAESAPAYDPATATSKVYGSTLFEGIPPTMASIKPGGSRFCVVNGRGISEEDVLVTKDKKLQNVIVYVRSGWQGKSYDVPGDPVVLDQQRCVYVPHVVTLGTGQKLRILNSDDTFHNVHAMSSVNQPINIAQPDKGNENTVTFQHAEPPFRIGCDLHRWMGVWVAVFDHPFHSLSGDSGNYEIKLPPGKYEIAAWHEKLGEKVMSVDVSSSAQVKLDFTFSAPDSGERTN